MGNWGTVVHAHLEGGVKMIELEFRMIECVIECLGTRV